MDHKKKKIARGNWLQRKILRSQTNINHLQLRLIRRKEIQQGLAMVASFAVLLSGCSFGNGTGDQGSDQSTNSLRVNNNNANDQVDAVFYENTEQCETDVKKQQAEYQVLLQAHESGKLATKPEPPALEPENCEAQIQAAKEEHERTAPVYNSQSDCQAEGLKCQPTPSDYSPSGYRPVFGGTYFYPYRRTEYIYVNRGGTRHRIYRPRTVYRSLTKGRVITPFGRSINRSSPGRVKAPRHTTVTAPTRPKGKAARGTIKGRSSRGFGSTFKGTGRGGK